MGHETLVTFEKGYAIVSRGRRKKIVSAETGRRILSGEESIAFSTDLQPRQSQQKRTSKKGPQKSAVERARQALGLNADDPRVTACPDGPCEACKMTGVIYAA